MIATRIRQGILVFLLAVFSLTAQAKSPVTGAFGVNLGDSAEAAVAQGFRAEPDTADGEIGVYGKLDSSAYMPFQTVKVSPATHIVWTIRAWRPIDERATNSIVNCKGELNALFAKLHEKYPTLQEVKHIPSRTTFGRTIAERIEHLKDTDVTLADGRYISLKCEPLEAPNGRILSRLMIWYMPDHRETERYQAESEAARKRLSEDALKQQGFDAKDF
jgi:hypothetical protein